MQLIIGILISLLKSYIAKLATKQFAEYVLFEVAEAIVKSTKTPHDDKWLKAIKATVKGQELPKD